jgi:hypothetical protein
MVESTQVQPLPPVAAPAKSLNQEATELFQRYPDLRAKLKKIYEQTLDPSSRGDVGGRPRNPRFEPRWSEQKGFDQGLAVLKAKLESEVVDTEDLEAFVTWVNSAV